VARVPGPRSEFRHQAWAPRVPRISAPGSPRLNCTLLGEANIPGTGSHALRPLSCSGSFTVFVFHNLQFLTRPDLSNPTVCFVGFTGPVLRPLLSRR